jgi:PAS domain S-box-containing protein
MQRWYTMLLPRSARSLGWLATGIASALAGLNLIGWMFGVAALKGILPHATPMKVITALCFALSSSALACLLSQSLVGWKRRLPWIAGIAVSSVGLLSLAAYLIEAATNPPFPWGLLPAANLFLAPDTRMAVIAAILFFIFGIVLLLLGTGTRRAANAAHLALLPVTLMSYMVIVGYLLNVHTFYAWTNVGVALNTGIAFCALCLAAFCVRADTWLMGILAGGRAGSIMARRMLPALLFLPILIGWLRIEGERAGLFSSELGVALVAITYTVCFLALTWLNAGSANRADEKLAYALQRLSAHMDNSPLAVIEFDSEIRVSRWSEEAERMFGWTAAEIVGKAISEMRWVYDEDVELVTRESGDLFGGRRPRSLNVNRNYRKDGSVIHCEWYNSAVHDAQGKLVSILSQILDVTERKHAERERELTIEFLQLVNKSTGTRDLIRTAATFFQQRSGCEAVGIRLKDGDDYPYYEARGFSEEFLLLENSLCVRGDLGEVVRDSAGYPIMACMCGSVIQGRFDPSKPFFTEHGSFWSSSTTELLATSTEADRQARAHSRCSGEGYESVALIPLHEGADRLGLLQLNDRRKGMFTLESITLWERLADHLAVALAKFEAEESLRESEQARAAEARLLDTIITATDNRLAYLDKDLRYRRVNLAYAANARMAPEAFVGRRRLEVFPNAPDVVAMFQRVLDTGEPEIIPEYTGIPLYRPEVGLRTVQIYAVPVRDERGEVEGVVTSMVDITDQVLARTRLVNAERARAEMAEGLNAEVNHRMKNNLMLVSAMLQMQIDAGVDDAPHALQLAISRISALSAVHEEMYAVHADRVRLEQVLRRVVAMVTDVLAGQEAEVEFAGDPVEVDSRMGSLVAIVANELVTNAIKHGGQENGRRRMSVELRSPSQDGLMTLRVWNSGNPIPADFDPVRQAGLGLQLVQMLAVQQSGGTFAVQPYDDGTLVTVSMNTGNTGRVE